MPDTEKEALCARIDELCAENEQLRQENQSICMAAYKVGYKDGSVHYELDHCPACKNVADLQEALEENAKLRDELAKWERLAAGIVLPEYPVTQFKPKDLERENVHLRGLVRYVMHQCNDGNPRCDECIDWNDGECVALQRMRELGVEVN